MCGVVGKSWELPHDCTCKQPRNLIWETTSVTCSCYRWRCGCMPSEVTHFIQVNSSNAVVYKQQRRLRMCHHSCQYGLTSHMVQESPRLWYEQILQRQQQISSCYLQLKEVLWRLLLMQVYNEFSKGRTHLSLGFMAHVWHASCP